MEYENMLIEAKKKLPQLKEKKERFEIPRVKGHIEGNKTIITNFLQICNVLHREPQQLVKYLQRELATPAVLKDKRLVFGRKVNSALLNEKIEKYAKDFVICKECNRPDTQLIKEDRVLFIKCTACGAKHTVRAKI